MGRATRTQQMRCLSLVVCGWAWAATAQPSGREINPGVLGPNALPPLENERPWVDEGATVCLGWAGQISTPHGGIDRSMLTPFRLSVGLARRVAFSADGAPFEVFDYSSQTQQAWQPHGSSGVTRADVRLATKVLLFDEHHLRPAAALRVTLKTATGEDLGNRRFIDAPAYQFDLIAGWHWSFGTSRLEAWLSVGFFAWQQGAAGQNDAVTWAATVLLRRALWSVRAETRGYKGWLQADLPIVLAATFDVVLVPQLEAFVGPTWTVRDPPSLGLSAGVRVRWPAD